MRRWFAAVEAVGSRIGRRRAWIVLPRMRPGVDVNLALLRWEGKGFGPYSSRGHARRVALALPDGNTAAWEAVPHPEHVLTDAPLPQPVTPEGGCR